jgi:acyl-CoA synthetase (AMP-forming)/AMP-acid ligase II
MIQGKPGSVENCETIVDLLRLRAGQQPNTLAYRFLLTGDADGPLQEWTYGELDLRARAIASRLQSAGAQGERILLLYPPGLEFVAAFLGCAYAGGVAVPAYPHRTLSRLEGIVHSAQARFVLTSSSFLKIGDSLSRQAPELAEALWMATDGAEEGDPSQWRQPEITGESLAFLQYTSGSTGQPKGVMVSHANVLHNERMIMQGFGTDPSMHVVGWLPLYHDMGLIGNVLHPLYLGASCTLMSPLSFLQRPARWLAAISRFRGTMSGGPNFAYDLCASKRRPDQNFDLSSWKVAFNGSEPVRKETMDRFAAAFQDCGFQPQAFYPCYGLAESTLFVTGIDHDALPPRQIVMAEGLERNLAIPAPEEGPATRTLVGSGRPQPEQIVIIVDPETRQPLPSGSIGEIWTRGPSVARGYWGLTEETSRTFAGRLTQGDGAEFLRTGDLGFMAGGELYITGRLKDLIIIRGRNLYPQDIEFTVQEAHPAIHKAAAAAFSLVTNGEEKLAIAAETDLRQNSPEAQSIVEAIRRAVAQEHGTHVHTIALLKPKALPKTSSGKIQRDACRQA